MKIVVDTNVVFSSILHAENPIAKLLISPGKDMEFFSGFSLKTELITHHQKLLKLSGYKLFELIDIEYLLTKNIEFIDETTIPLSMWIQARKLVKGIDESDIPFVAMTLYTNSLLLTDDKLLSRGLIKNGFDNIISSSELIKIIQF